MPRVAGSLPFVESDDFGQPADVAFLLAELCSDKSFDEFESNGFADNPTTQTQDVHVVVFYRLVRGVGVVGHGRTNALDLVGGDTGAGARPTDHDPSVGPSVDNCSAHGRSEIRVVHRFVTVSPEVEHGQTEFGEMAGDGLLEGEAGVVGSEGDSHAGSVVAGLAPPAP